MIRSTLALALILAGLTLSAQVTETVEPMSRFKVRSFNVGLNGAADVYNNMSMQWMRDHTSNPTDIDFDGTGYEQTNHARVSSGGLGVQLSLVPLDKETMLYNNKHEFQIGVHSTLGREAMVSFTREEVWTDSEARETIIFCLLDNEVSFNLGYVYSMYHGPFRVFGGPRLMGGSVVTSDMLKMQSTSYTYYDANGNIEDTDFVSEDTEYYAANEAKYARAFAQVGIGAKVFRSVELVATYSHGIGVEQIKDGPTSWMSHTYSFRGGVNWIFGQKKPRTAPSI